MFLKIKSSTVLLSFVMSAVLLTFSLVTAVEAFNVPDTGQTQCYNGLGNLITCPAPGQLLAQDGSYTINPLSYTDNTDGDGNPDGTVTDNKTGLMWQKEDTVSNYNWYQASGTPDATSNPSSQNVCGSLDLGGYSDWRLPTNEELVSIVNYGTTSPAIDGTAFPYTDASYYWTSTPKAGAAAMAWYVNFAFGVESNNGTKTNNYYVRCVRGEPYPAQSLTANGNGTVTDDATGLMWQQGENDFMTWEESLAFCEGLALGGQTDWRLPNIKELETLTDDTRTTPAIDTSFFPAAGLSYWSSTTLELAGSTVNAWRVDVLNGGVVVNGSKAPSNTWFARCVRGGESGPIPDAPIVAGTTPTIDSTPTWTWISGGGGGNGTFRYQRNSESGAWTETTGLSFTPISALSVGTHTLYVQERDDTDNWSLSGSFTITIDADSDSDGMADAWEIQHFGNLSRNGSGDLDVDGVSDYQEYLNGTDPASCPWDITHLNACVNHASILKNCLAESQADGKHNTIKVVQGTYTGLFAYNSNENFDLNLEGGYVPGCATFSYNPELTILNGDINTDTFGDGVVLDLNNIGTGNITVEGFHVKNGFNGVDDGGCIRIFTATGDSTVSANVVSQCEAAYAGGIGVQTDSGAIDIINNIVYGNIAAQGGGIGVGTITGVVTILNNTISGNTSVETGGGLAVASSNNAVTTGIDITNNIIWGNTAQNTLGSPCAGGDVVIDSNGDSNGTHAIVLFRNNDLNTTTGICSTNPLFTLGVGNLDVNPQFVDAANGNYHLTNTSPLINMGNSAHAGLPSVDIDGQARIVGASVDLGADEVMLLPGIPVVTATTPTADTTPTWTWTSGGGGNGTFRYRLDNPDLSTGATTTTLTSFTPATALSNGTYTLYVQEQNADGLWSATGSKTVLIETTAAQYNLTVTKSGTGSGKVISAPLGIDCGGDCVEGFAIGTKATKVSLTAIPDPGSTFKGWSGAYIGTKTKLSLLMDGNKAAVAEFALPDLTGTFSGTLVSFKKTSYQISTALTVIPGEANAANVTIKVYLSDDGIQDGGDTLLTPTPLPLGAMTVGKVKPKKLKITSLTNPSGKYLIAVLDPDNTVLETDDSNNIVVRPIP